MEDKKSKKVVIVIIIVVVSVCVLAVGGFLIVKGGIKFANTMQKYSEVMDTKEQKNQMQLFEAELNELSLNLQTVNTTIDTKISCNGDLGKYEQFIKDTVGSALQAGKSYEDAIGNDSIWDEYNQKLKQDDKKLTKTKQKMSGIKANLDGYYNTFINALKIEIFQEELDKYSFNEDQKKEILDMVNKNIIARATEFQQAKDITEKMWTEMEGAVNYLANNQSKWYMSGDTIMFYGQSYLNKYESYENNLFKYSEELSKFSQSI